MVVYSGEHKLKELIEFLRKEMEKAKEDRVLVNNFLNSSIQVNCSVCASVCLRAAFDLKINLFHSACLLQEDEDRRQYMEAVKAEEAKKANTSRDEL